MAKPVSTRPKNGQINVGYGAPQVQTVLHLKTAVRDRAPSDLQLGQIAVNFNWRSPTLWIKDSRDDIVAINPQATTSRQGMAELATRSQAIAGTNNTTIITPKRLAQVLFELNIGGDINGGDAAGNVVIDGGSAATTVFATSIDGGQA